MIKKNRVIGLAILVSALMVVGSAISVPNLAWGATINCNPIPNVCTGTGNADTMTATGSSGNGQYQINGLAGSDTIYANELSGFDSFLVINGGDNDDKIIAKRTGGQGLQARGDAGNDLLTLNAGAGTQSVHGAGGPGSDTITVSGGVNEVQLRQNNDGNDPDGSKDILNCGGAPDSTAYISEADGDIPVNCKVVIKSAIS